MTISYKWLSEYLPVSLDPERLSKILTSIGLEVESLEKYESVKGGLDGLVIGEVLECEQHPNADKLKVTKVNIGSGDPLQVVCGAPNVAAGQKVVVATVGTTIYPSTGDPLTMKVAKIRGVESFGMICAEDEVGMGQSHAGIMVLPANVKVGMPAAEYFQPYTDFVYEIGLTPNRMDAMSHLGVARDVCAYLTHHDKGGLRVKAPSVNAFKVENHNLPIAVTIENPTACQRYAGVSISGVTIKESPKWLKDKLQAIGLRPINNIVDITNFVLHETGQPLHAFDADAVAGKKVIVKNLPQDTVFVTLDEKERKLSSEDLMICNDTEPMCIAGVFGGLKSGVKDTTTNIFLESAWFNPTSIRKTSFRHGLRTDAATRFEKGVDISATVNVLKRAALLIKEIAGGEISSDLVDVYPQPKDKTVVSIKYHYLRRLSGKTYHSDTVKKILEALGFEVVKDGIDELFLCVPYSKPDISIPADIVEEILRIDGLDNVTIPHSILISPAVEADRVKESFRMKVANYLVGQGFSEIMTNSITNSNYYSEDVLQHTVKLMNNLSVELDIMRPAMLETGLESVAHNINRKNNNLNFFEFGKTYSTSGVGHYEEQEHLTLFISGNASEDSWKQKAVKSDIYRLKGIAAAILKLAGIDDASFEALNNGKIEGLSAKVNTKHLLSLGTIAKKTRERFDIKQEVLFADFDWKLLRETVAKKRTSFTELPKQLPVQRDLAIIVDKSLPFEAVEKAVKNAKASKLQNVSLFDIFESDKLGTNKKSMAVSFSFLDEEKTLTDKEIDSMMSKIMASVEKELQAEIRK
ncbi:phenylalanine--tRNA ligase subunit beta [Pinibacter soli]|uniref:Phenylalanine--tRNA ligase beta subunit n=1 Tax=Pinibacter soli TaxID=3044211 RepID=A0ABT6R8S6_9BACT|nr:phenylalanine--tRNA ligase subunit beta [Pinibacter soli]MDI3318964.1 phenylalanine--tRNA ligase subunit beta [Pinibacter soli]